MSGGGTHWRKLGGNAYLAELPGAKFQIRLESETVPLLELCDVALRNNERRRFLFVSKVLGRHWPTRPSQLRSVAAALASGLPLAPEAGPVVFIGMAETATTLGQTVFDEWLKRGGNGLYIESTRRRTGGRLAFSFNESHSHATAHFIHEPSSEDDPEGCLRKARQVVVVDDEATTGNTAADFARGLRTWRGSDSFFSARLAVLLRWSQGAWPTGWDHGVALTEGQFDFETSEELPPVVDRSGGSAPSGGPLARRGARHGIKRPESLPLTWLGEIVQPGEQILFVGGGEHGFRPLLLAEHFERLGAVAWVQATTRSPILIGGAISHARSFPALSGEGYLEFLYNVPDDHRYDRVVLCLEDPSPPSSHPIWRIPRLQVLA